MAGLQGWQILTHEERVNKKWSIRAQRWPQNSRALQIKLNHAFHSISINRCLVICCFLFITVQSECKENNNIQKKKKKKKKPSRLALSNLHKIKLSKCSWLLTMTTDDLLFPSFIFLQAVVAALTVYGWYYRLNYIQDCDALLPTTFNGKYLKAAWKVANFHACDVITYIFLNYL